jgi:hypothetical protein
MVEKIKAILDSLRVSGRPVWLAALLKMDDLVDRWALIISAPWINPENRDTEFRTILALLQQKLTREELVSIVRFGLFDRDNHLVEQLVNRPVNSRIQEEQINGNIVHEGIILESDPNLNWSPDNLFSVAANGE